MNAFSTTRRDFLTHTTAAGLAAASLPALGSLNAFAAEGHGPMDFPVGKAEHCVFIWLGGGACQIDTWDPKRKGDAKAKKPGSYYDPIDTAIPGVQVCEHLKRCAPLLDRFNPLRTVHHDVIDEHAAATNRVHTGRPTAGTVIYPSVGSIIAHERGPAGDKVPAYVLIGYPNVTRGPGYLGSKHGYIYLTDTQSGPAGLTKPSDITTARRDRREQLLARMRSGYEKRVADQTIADYDDTVAEALRLAGPQFMSTFELDREPGDLRNGYGSEFGQRLLLTRRLIERGVRFIEVSHNLNFINGTGWDTHNDGQLNQHSLIQDLDQALAALVLDLERTKLLDKTLIVVATEFGRPAGFDGGGGRGHHSKAFSIIFAGGGLKTGQVIGETDELGQEIVSRPVSIPDMHATIHCALGINPAKELFAGDRPVPITDMGQPVRELFA